MTAVSQESRTPSRTERPVRTWCPSWCDIDHARIETDGGSHTTEVATWIGGGAVDYVKHDGTYVVHVWHEGEVVLDLPASGAWAVLREVGRGLLEAAQRIEELEAQR